MPFVAALRHQLPLHVDHMPPYKTESCMNCELHLATRHLWRNTEGRPSDPKEDRLEEQRPHFSHKNVVCTTQVSPSGRRPEQNRPRRGSYSCRDTAPSATYLSREDRAYVPWSYAEHTSDRCRPPCEPDDSGCKADGTPTFHAVSCLSWTPSPRKQKVLLCSRVSLCVIRCHLMSFSRM